MNLDLQHFVFRDKPTRRQLLAYSDGSSQENGKRIQVFRNHSFELVEHALRPYLEYSGLGLCFDYSGYDDSFSFADLDKSADGVLFWIDATRYNGVDVAKLIVDRVALLKSQFHGPVLIAPFGCDVVVETPNILVYNISSVAEKIGGSLTDRRVESLTGTPLSSKALTWIARDFGLVFLPALLMPELKAVVVDLDNTLYSGVLGEDGPDGLVLTEGHERLQKTLQSIANTGVFLCGISKNNQIDVEDLFSCRSDFPLRLSDFTFICASWDPKPAVMNDVLKRLNIGSDSVLFVDDNIGEILSMEAAFPSMKLLCAYEDASLTQKALESFPGIMRTSHTKEDAVRKEDVRANAVREEMMSALSKEEFIRQLGLRLSFNLDDRDHIARIAQLSNKTNQFIFNYARYTEADVGERFDDPSYSIVTISLADTLTDSGLIGVCVGHRIDQGIAIEECFISCRALGRGIDDAIVLGAIRLIQKKLGDMPVKVEFQHGPRNEPASRFVEEHLQAHLTECVAFSYELPTSLLDTEIIGL